jgi:diphosphomevalonate decarboxylase
VDLVLLAGREEKEVSSSEAHKRVLTSPLWAGRTSRAEARVAQVEQFLREGDWNGLTRLVWQESMEMHSLFHTSEPPFTYWLPRSLEIIRGLSRYISDGVGPAALPSPLVTMDAGPNVHVLVPENSAAAWKRELAVRFPGLDILEDRAGRGAGVYVPERAMA